MLFHNNKFINKFKSKNNNKNIQIFYNLSTAQKHDTYLSKERLLNLAMDYPVVNIYKCRESNLSAVLHPLVQMLNRLKFQGFFHFNIFWELSLIILLFSWMSHPDQLHYVARPPVLLDIELTLISHRISKVNRVTWTGELQALSETPQNENVRQNVK